MANDAFLQAEFMQAPDRLQARQLLRGYMKDRLAIHDLARQGRLKDVLPLLANAEAVHRDLWELASRWTLLATTDSGADQARGPFTQSVIGQHPKCGNHQPARPTHKIARSKPDRRGFRRDRQNVGKQGLVPAALLGLMVGQDLKGRPIGNDRHRRIRLREWFHDPHRNRPR